MKECIFCQIASGEKAAFKLYEDDSFLAFLDINPIREGHILLIPKIHCSYIFSLDEELYMTLMLKVRQLAAVLARALEAERIGILTSGIAVPHVHIHLLPVFNRGDIDPRLAKPASRAYLAEIHQKLLPYFIAMGANQK